MSLSAHIEPHMEPLPDLATLAPRWQALEARAQGSFFLGWTWIGSWLEASGARPDLLTVARDGVEIALALIGAGKEKRKFGTVPSLSLNEAGHADADRPFIEYNGLLVARADAEEAHAIAAQKLAALPDWRVLRLSGLEPGNALVHAIPARRRILRDSSPAYHVELAAVRAAEGDYLSLLSANSRNQIRRSFKDHGEARIAIARSPAEIEAWLEDMRQLNAGRHADNAWDHDGFCRFTRTIALHGLASGEVELLRIDCGGERIGYLLNFVYRGRAMNYQSAFIAPPTPKSKPGLMCHAAAVAHHAEAGLDLYSLLAGKDRYKQSLSTGQEWLEWWSIERFAPALEIEALVRRLLRR